MDKQNNLVIQWQLYDPLGRKYFWIEVVDPIIPLTVNKKDQKIKARELAE